MLQSNNFDVFWNYCKGTVLDSAEVLISNPMLQDMVLSDDLLVATNFTVDYVLFLLSKG